MRYRLFLFLLLSLTLTSGCGGISASPDAPRVKNVVLISIDTLRADHVGAYGYERKITPNIDRLAGESTRFTQAFSSSNWTLPAHAGMFSGLMSSGHGAIRAEDAIRPETNLLAEHLQKTGMATAAFVSHVYVSEKYGFDRGFETFDYRQGRSAAELTDGAIDWLENREKGKPFFLFLHYFDVHDPYGDARDKSLERIDDPDCRGPKTRMDIADATIAKDWEQFPCFRQLYDRDVAYVDKHLGRLLDHLRSMKLLGRTLVIVVSDHGEMLGEYEAAGHGLTLFDPEIRIPLLMRFPGGERGRVVDDLVSSIQLAPTIMEALGVPPFPTDLPSLLPLLRGAATGPEWISAETRKVGNEMIAVIDTEYKAVLPPTNQLYGVVLSPSLVRRTEPEDINLWFEKPALAGKMMERAAESGWYGKGVCYEIIFVAEADSPPPPFTVTVPEGVAPVVIAPIATYPQLQEKSMLVEEAPVRREGNTYQITPLAGYPLTGYVVVVDPPDAQVTIAVPGLAQRPDLPLYVGQVGKQGAGGSVTLNGPTGEYERFPETTDSYILIRSYPVIHLQRPNMGPLVPARPLDKAEQRALRSLGYLGP